jgi:basic membrane protein A and related proteins
MKRTLRTAALAALALTAVGLAFVGCAPAKPKNEVAIVCSAAGKNDNGYNQSAIEGLAKAEASLKITTKVVETSDSLTVPNALKQLAAAGTKVIFSLEYDFDALVNGVGGEKPLAAQYPNTTFVVFNANPNLDKDGKPKFKNVISVLFDVHEASFLAGYLSVYVNENLKSLFVPADYAFNLNQKTNRKLGFIGGTASDGIQVFSYGFMEGASLAAGELGAKYSYISKYDAGFGDASVGASFAGSCYGSGANIVYAVAGNVGTGVTSKAADAKRLAIEVDANKDSVRPGNILTSVLKNTNVPVVAISEAYKSGKLAALANVISYNLDSGATGITDLQTISGKIAPSGKAAWEGILAKLAAVSDKVKKGEIKITNAQAGEKFNPKTVPNLAFTTEAGFVAK